MPPTAVISLAPLLLSPWQVSNRAKELVILLGDSERIRCALAAGRLAGSQELVSLPPGTCTTRTTAWCFTHPAPLPHTIPQV